MSYMFECSSSALYEGFERKQGLSLLDYSRKDPNRGVEDMEFSGVSKK